MVIRTEASDETAKHFERLRRSFSKVLANDEVGRHVMFAQLLDIASLRQAQQDEQSA